MSVETNSHTPFEEQDGVRYHLIAAQLVEELAGGRLAFRVRGTSMVPTLRPGDTVIAEPVEVHSLRRGDLVVWRDGHRYIVHRLVARSPAGLWYTKGDNLADLDPPVPDEAIFGRVVAVKREGGYLRLDTRRAVAVSRLLGAFGRLEAWLASVARRLPLRLLRRLYRRARGWLWGLLVSR